MAFFANIFSLSVVCLFILFTYFAVQKLLSFSRCHLFIFAFLGGGWLKKMLLWFMWENALPTFSSRSCMISYLIFRSLSHLSLFLCMMWGSVLTSLICMLSQHHLLKRLSSIVYSWLLCQRLIGCRCVGLFLRSLFYSIDSVSVLVPRCLVIVALWYCLKSRKVMPPAFSCFLRIALAILDLLWFDINSKII